MKRFVVLFALASVLLVSHSVLTAAPLLVPNDLLVRGDMSDNEILRYRRIRVERQEVLYDDTQPMICRVGSTVMVAGQKGSLARSSDGGLHWETLENVAASGGNLAAIGSVGGETLLAALQDGKSVTILASSDLGQTWKNRGTVKVPNEPSDLRGRFAELADGSVLLSLANSIFRSTDQGASWSHHTTLPTGLSDLRPVVLRSGRLLASALYTGGGGQDYRNTVIAESTDSGKRWKVLAAATRIGQVPGDLVELSDGRLVLS